MKTTVFMGGTCGSSTWRKDLTKMLGEDVEAFNPVVPDWTPECQAVEDAHKANDDVVLFVITPETPGTYSISEITRSSITQPERTMICVIPEANGKSFEAHEVKAWNKILKDCKKDGATVCATLEDVAMTLNQRAKKPIEPGDE